MVRALSVHPRDINHGYDYHTYFHMDSERLKITITKNLRLHDIPPVIADALIEKLGGGSLSEMKPRFEALRKAKSEDLQMRNQPQVWWE